MLIGRKCLGAKYENKFFQNTGSLLETTLHPQSIYNRHMKKD